jgi:hypothetical protein
MQTESSPAARCGYLALRITAHFYDQELKELKAMQPKTPRKLNHAEIGFKGKPIDTLSKEELLEAFLELAQRVYDCASQDNSCKDLFSINS